MSDVLIPNRAGEGAVGRIASSLAALKRDLVEQAPELAPRLDQVMGETAGTAVDAPAAVPCDAIPEIDYARHPYYGDLGNGGNLRPLAADRFFEIFTGMVRTEQAAAARLDQGGTSAPSDASRREAADVLERE